MGKYIENYQKRRLISSYFSVVLTIALVLFLLGVLGIFLLNANKLVDQFKEQIAISVFLKDSAKEIDIKQMQKSLALAHYTKSAQYVSKEEAAEQFVEKFGENFEDFLGYNPLKNSFDVHIKAGYMVPDSLAIITENIANKSIVEEISYDQPLVSKINDNVNRIGFWILVTSAVFALIASLLINSSIRLSIYSKRFIIKTMQMVGATKNFIRKPFMATGVKLGTLGAVIAILGLMVLLYLLNQRFPELDLLGNLPILGLLFLGVLLIGALISLLSTYLATQRFLKLRSDDLYF